MLLIHDHKKITLADLSGKDAIVFVHGYQFKLTYTNIFKKLITVTDESGMQFVFCTLSAVKQFLETKFRETLGARKM